MPLYVVYAGRPREVAGIDDPDTLDIFEVESDQEAIDTCRRRYKDYDAMCFGLRYDQATNSFEHQPYATFDGLPMSRRHRS